MNTISSRDFYLAAYLTAIGLELKGHTKDGNITNFEFENTPTFTEESKKYYALKAMVNPVAMGNCIRNLKSIIHSSA